MVDAQDIADAIAFLNERDGIVMVMTDTGTTPYPSSKLYPHEIVGVQFPMQCPSCEDEGQSHNCPSCGAVVGWVKLGDAESDPEDD